MNFDWFWCVFSVRNRERLLCNFCVRILQINVLKRERKSLCERGRKEPELNFSVRERGERPEFHSRWEREGERHQSFIHCEREREGEEKPKLHALLSWLGVCHLGTFKIAKAWLWSDTPLTTVVVNASFPLQTLVSSNMRSCEVPSVSYALSSTRSAVSKPAAQPWAPSQAPIASSYSHEVATVSLLQR